jgi:glucosylceramidase
MKTTGRMNEGGQLRPECRAAWAQCYVRFIQAYAAEGVPIWGVSVQNEPEATQRWDSCIYSAEEERDFVRDHLGPALHAAGLGHVKIVVLGPQPRRTGQRAASVYADPEAAKYVWGTGFHWYVEDHFDHVQLVHDAWPDKAAAVHRRLPGRRPARRRWGWPNATPRSMINDLNRWTVGWIDWNLLLDEQGGPNHVGNFCSAPVLADAGRRRRCIPELVRGLGHFARFMQPGAQRVLCAATREALECTAFANPDGSCRGGGAQPQ